MLVNIHSRMLEVFIATLLCHCPMDWYQMSVFYAIHTDHENGIFAGTRDLELVGHNDPCP